MKDFSIGIDLGGTKILGAVVSEGEVLFKAKNKTKKEKGNKKITKKLFETIDELLEISNIDKKQIKSIGLGVAGQVDRDKGILINAVNLDCQDLKLKELIEEKYGIKTYVGNDVECATLGELKFGAGVGYKNIVCVFVGTGIGSSIVMNGEIYKGATGTAGEIGHIIVDLNGRACACGGVGCLEAYASRSAIESRILGAIKKGRKSIITDIVPKLNSISSKHIKQSLDAHDEVVCQYVDEAINYLSGGLASVINFYNPELIILGGGLIQSVDEIYLETIRRAKARALPIPSQKIEFKRAMLGDFSGVIGATLLDGE